MNGPIWREPVPPFKAYEELLKQFRVCRRSASDPRGSIACRTEMIEPMKAHVREGLPPGVIPIIGTGDAAERTDTVEFIEAYCRVCGLCEGFMARPPPPVVPRPPAVRRNRSG